MKTILLLGAILLSLLAPIYAAGESCSAQEISEQARQQAALTALQTQPQTVMVYAKGMICQSCGIGVRKKLQRLDFIDKSQFNKGILMDVKTQLVTLALKDGHSYNATDIAQAIIGAGYTPETLYTLNAKNKLQTISLAQE